ncbi:magnesium transporter MRS2-5-like [Tasmannia lanceolata]|uniref:magnesium transporter MRS2-5-like n=1 Tax=Tasmannia lanceolata TaxID=3420 RepID=UPI004062A49C
MNPIKEEQEQENLIGEIKEEQEQENLIGEMRTPFLPSNLLERISFPEGATLDAVGRPLFQGFGFSYLKRRCQGSRSWIQIDRNGNSKLLVLDKATIMRRCNLPARDIRLLDPLFVYPSTISGREKAIIVNVEQLRCIITADEVILMNSLDSCVMQYESELCKRLEAQKDQTDNLAFEFRALELALELACTSLDAQVTELEIEVYPVIDELASSISILNLERVHRFKSHLLALTRSVQKVRDEIEKIMDDDGDMAKMFLTKKKERIEAYSTPNISPVGSSSGSHKMERLPSSVMSLSKHGRSLMSSSNNGECIEELEMLLEAYFVVIDDTLGKLLSLKEYVDNTEDFINIKLDTVQNQLIQFELMVTAAAFVATVFTVVTGVFGMRFTPSFFDQESNFNWVLIVTGICCGSLFLCFLLYSKYKRLPPL